MKIEVLVWQIEGLPVIAERMEEVWLWKRVLHVLGKPDRRFSLPTQIAVK